MLNHYVVLYSWALSYYSKLSMVAEFDERANGFAGFLALILKARSKRTDSIGQTCIKKSPLNVTDKEQFTRGKKKRLVFLQSLLWLSWKY